jgi:two-component system, OmpR family, sensor kinase
VMGEDQRWRLYVLPLARSNDVVGYLVGLAPLGRLDQSIQSFRSMLLALGLLGLGVALISSRAVASQALQPIASIVHAAHGIAESRDLSCRISVPLQRDELGVLAETFNTMLTSIESAYRAQQRFVADASHELRTPLTTIQGNLEIIRRERAMAEPDRMEALAETEREAARLSRLVADLLALARADAGATLAQRPVDMDAIVIDTFHTARQLACGQSLSLEPFEPARVLGDEDRLRQVIIVLLDNALKYTPADGQVHLGLQVCGAQAEILVRDTGIGIPESDLPHVFERFYRADPARSRDSGGIGLGLAIARWIVEQHGGSITLDSTLDQGTTARVRLPLAS